ELAAQDGHADDVAVASVLEVVLAAAALLHEAAFTVAGLRAGIGIEHTESDLVQVHLLKAEAQQGKHGVGAVAVGPERLIADHDPQLRVAVFRPSAMKTANADVQAVLLLDRQAQVGEAVTVR